MGNKDVDFFKMFDIVVVANCSKDEAETKSVKKVITFVSLVETLKVDWSTDLCAKRIRRMDPSVLLLWSSSPSSPRLITHPDQPWLS